VPAPAGQRQQQRRDPTELAVALPAPVIDYVVVHEPSHLRVMDHGLLILGHGAVVVPDYAQLRAQLKDDSVPRCRVSMAVPVSKTSSVVLTHLKQLNLCLLQLGGGSHKAA
jgi:hypothetical protein